MEEILARQQNAPSAVSGKAFFTGVLGVVIRLAIAQMLVNVLITVTGIGLLNIAFYLYAIVLLAGFMGKTVAGSLYMLKESTLFLQKKLGDSTISVVEIPLEHVVSVRPVFYGERLACSYRRVTVIDPAAAQPLRMRIAFGISLISARLARRIAGDRAMDMRGYIVVYEDEGKRHACVFRPDDEFLVSLRAMLPKVCDYDERSRENTPVTLWAQALERTFPQLYAHVSPLVSDERAQAACEEIERQKQIKADKKRKGKAPISGAEDKEEAGKTDEVQDDTL